jgi:hypothetical protein
MHENGWGGRELIAGGRSHTEIKTAGNEKNIPSGPRSTLEGLESETEAGPNRLLGGIIQTLCGTDDVRGTLDVAFFILFFHGGCRRFVLLLEFRHDGQLAKLRVAMENKVV